jgi:glycogen debranching enzyme
MIPQEFIPVEEGRFHIPADAVNYDDRIKVLNHSDTFAIFDRWGDIHPHSKKAQGIFHQGTRFINRLELRVNQKKPLLLSSCIKEDNDILSVDLTNPDLTACNILGNSLHISRSQFVRNGVYYEEMALVNFGSTACNFDVSLTFGADFKDLFEIRGIPRKLNPNKPDLTSKHGRVLFDYEGLDKIHRRTEIIFSGKEELSVKHNVVSFSLALKPHQHQKINYLIVFHSEENIFSKDEDKEYFFDFVDAKKAMRETLHKTHKLFASISTSNEQFSHWVNRSKADLISLLTLTDTGLYPYAGVPWYNTAFGRDGIITAMEVLWIAPQVAKDALVFLAEKQATEHNPEKDAEPGKIMHETRTGEMANTEEIPFKEYYGTIDATPLFIMLAGMYYKHTADITTVEKIWPNIKAALSWIDKYGDLDGDGFVEYKHKSENGLTNQGWKDSHDSVMYKNGGLCEPPIALCEVQGYVYSAKKYASELAAALKEVEYAQQLSKEAVEFRKKFNEVFWDETLDSYVLALDGNKKPCRVVTSNSGHCLFTGIAEYAHAQAMAKTFTSRDMFSGWGIRTLSAKEKRYNPMSYHNGSIWPHDNALIALGLAQYGFQKEALKVMSALFDASLFIDMQRLPELYCGFERRVNEGPTAYPVACSPQAWSVATVFLLLQACLRIEINALEKTIGFIKPELPRYLDKITITNLKTGNDYCDFELYRNKYDVGFHFMRKPADWEVIIKK